MVFTRKADSLFNFHLHFAFLPITFVEGGDVKTVWLRFIKRKLVSNMMGTHWVYSM